MELIIKEPLYIMSKKDYATGERTLEGITLENREVNLQMILTFKNKDAADPDKNFLKLSGSYKVVLIPVDKEA